MGKFFNITKQSIMTYNDPAYRAWLIRERNDLVELRDSDPGNTEQVNWCDKQIAVIDGKLG